MDKAPFPRREFDGSGSGRHSQQGAARAVEALVAQVGHGADAKQIPEEFLHPPPGESEGEAEVVEVDGFALVVGEKLLRLAEAVEAPADPA